MKNFKEPDVNNFQIVETLSHNVKSTVYLNSLKCYLTHLLLLNRRTRMFAPSSQERHGHGHTPLDIDGIGQQNEQSFPASWNRYSIL